MLGFFFLLAIVAVDGQRPRKRPAARQVDWPEVQDSLSDAQIREMQREEQKREAARREEERIRQVRGSCDIVYNGCKRKAAAFCKDWYNPERTWRDFLGTFGICSEGTKRGECMRSYQFYSACQQICRTCWL